jgi:hypothetical protein
LPTGIILVGSAMGWGMNKVYNILEQHGDSINKISNQVDLINQQFILRSQRRDEEINGIKSLQMDHRMIIGDHENRIRTLERKP